MNQFHPDRFDDSVPLGGDRLFLGPNDAPTLSVGDHRPERDPALRRREGPERHIASDPEASAQGALGLRRSPGARVVNRGEELQDGTISGPRLNRERPLTGSRGHDFRRQRSHPPILNAKTTESGGRDDDRIEVPRIEPAEAGPNVPAEFPDLEVGPAGQQLRASAEAARPDPDARA